MTKLNAEDIRKILPQRAREASKFDCGRGLLICGSERYMGAPFFAAQAAVNSGCGLCYLSVPKEILPILGVKLNEPVFVERGEIECNCSKFDGTLIGPGIGRGKDAEKLTEEIVLNAEVPTVIDADALYFLSKNPKLLKNAKAARILTPHLGEFKRLVPDADTDNAVVKAIEFAKENRCIMVLKGADTVITDGDISYVNTTGNQGMAKGGSGDVLAGIIVSFLCQGLSPIDAARAGVYIHGLAGDMARDEFGVLGMTPTDTLNMVKKALHNV